MPPEAALCKECALRERGGHQKIRGVCMTLDDLRILIQEGEGTKLKFKEALSSLFVREIVARGNTIGGEILPGEHDSNTLRARIQDIARNCDPLVEVRAETEERPMERVAGEDRLRRVMPGEMTRQRLQEALGLKNENHFRETYLIPALRSGLIEMMIPDKPSSSKQCYHLAAAAGAYLKQTEEKQYMSKVDITGTKLVWFGKDNVVFQSRSVTNKWAGYTTKNAGGRNHPMLWEQKS